MDSEFAQAVLAFDGVASVFGVNDFVTITREPDADWDAIVCAVEDAAAEHLEASSGAPASDEVAEARKLLRNAVAPPKPRPVEIGRPPTATLTATPHPRPTPPLCRQVLGPSWRNGGRSS